MIILRRLATFTAVVAGLLALSAGPADARPLIDPPTYNGPAYSHAEWFAGRHATGCIAIGVFSMEACAR